MDLFKISWLMIPIQRTCLLRQELGIIIHKSEISLMIRFGLCTYIYIIAELIVFQNSSVRPSYFIGLLSEMQVLCITYHHILCITQCRCQSLMIDNLSESYIRELYLEFKMFMLHILCSISLIKIFLDLELLLSFLS